MMNFTMMTMVTQTSRARRLIKNDFLYTDTQLKEMKAQLRVLKEELAVAEAKTSKGFGK